MATLADEDTLRNYETAHLKKGGDTNAADIRKFIPEIAEIAGGVVESLGPPSDPLFLELF